MDAIAILDKVSYMCPRSDRLVLADVSLTIRQGEFLGLIGPTGAGKTTLCLTLNGIVPQFYGGRFFGRITVAGLDSLESPVSTLAQHVGIVLDDPEVQLTATSVENEIAFALENLNVPRDEIIARIGEVLEAVRLEGLEKRHPHELSGGQKQRLAIAAALALRPELLVLDEPTSQLDPVGTQEIFATVRELNRELGISVLMASHAAEELAEHADRLALISGSVLLQSGTPDALYGDVDLLQKHDLRPPQVATTFRQLEHAGLNVPRIPVRLDQAIQAVQDLRAAGKLPAPDSRTAPPVTGVGQQPSLILPSPKAPLLSARDLHYTYDNGTQALRGVSLDIAAGEYLLIAGQNGAGKSTLVKHFLRLLDPTTGTVRVGDKDTRDATMGELAQRIGYVAQNPDNQIFSASVEAEVGFALKHLGYSPHVVETRVEEALTAMDLLGDRHRHPLSLPKGDRARVVIAAILAMHPDVVIFDEPTTGQDYRGARQILDISRDLHQAGKTIIVVTHHLYLMADYAQRVIIMGKGDILLDGDVRTVFNATGTLRGTYLVPPQAILLAQAACPSSHRHSMLTPDEVAACLARGGA